MSYLVDTNVIAELVRPNPNANVLRWARSVEQVFVSAISVEEIVFGLAANPNARVLTWFEIFVARRCRILEVTAAIARQAGQMRGALVGRGRLRSQADTLIAATSAQYGATLVTRNLRDFESCGVVVLNPFEPIASGP